MEKVWSAAARWLFGCVLVGSLSACGNDGSGDPGIDPDAGMPAGEPIIIGQVLEESGFQAARSERWAHAVELAISQVNAAGGIQGRPLMLDKRDGESNGEVAAMRLDELLADHPTLQAVLAGGTSGTAVAVGNVAADRGIPMITGTASVDWLGRDRETLVPNDNGCVFRTQGTTSEQVDGLVELMSIDGMEKVAVLWFDNVFTTNYRDSLADRWNSTVEIGREISLSMEHLDEITDPGALIAAAAATEPDAIVMLNFATHAERILSEWRDNGGFDGKWYLINSTCDQVLVDAVGARALEGFTGVTVHQEDGPLADAFAAAYEESYGSPPGGLDDQWYDAAMLIALAIAKAGPNATGTDVRDALSAVSTSPGTLVNASEIGTALAMLAEDPTIDINYEGASGPVDFDLEGDIRKGIDLCEVRGGEIVTTPIR